MPVMDEHVKKMVSEKFKQLKAPVNILFFKPAEGTEMSAATEELLNEIAAASQNIKKEVLEFGSNDTKAKEFGVDKTPAIVLYKDKKTAIRFYGFPGGYEFETFLTDILDVSTGAPDLPLDVIAQVKKIDFPVHMQVFVTPQCPYCASAVKLAHDFGLINPNIKADGVEVMEFRELGMKYKVMSVPKTVVNDSIDFKGTYPSDIVIKKILELKK